MERKDIILSESYLAKTLWNWKTCKMVSEVMQAPSKIARTTQGTKSMQENEVHISQQSKLVPT